ncbi:MAG: hypothetical protein K2L88_07335, partial [Clostridiales bacterium]|nr:hypothetical protein [Clostridiales bacterium]
GIVTVFLDKLSYFKVKSAIIRAAIAIVFFNVTVGCVYAIAVNVMTIGIDVNISDWAGMVGGYAVFALIATVVLVPLDFVFATLAVTVLKKIPARLTKAEMIKQKQEEQKNDEQPKEPEYDIFGYEIRHDDKDEKR